VRAYRVVDEELAELSYEQLLVPLDGSQRAECVLPAARAVADYHNCRLLVAHVVPRPEVPRHAPLTEEETDLVERLTELNRRHGQEYLEDVEGRLSPGVETRLLVSDNAAAALHELVSEEDADMVLLSAHGYSGEAQWPYGSVALNFIAYGTTPLLIVQDISRAEIGTTPAEKAASEAKGH
ncbi:MAG: universal stress protein, partial [Anaerolineae bacterium]